MSNSNSITLSVKWGKSQFELLVAVDDTFGHLKLKVLPSPRLPRRLRFLPPLNMNVMI